MKVLRVLHIFSFVSVFVIAVSCNPGLGDGTPDTEVTAEVDDTDDGSLATGDDLVDEGNVSLNTAPIAVDQSETEDEDVAITFTITAATDANGDALTYTLVTPPSGGILSGCVASSIAQAVITIGSTCTYTQSVTHANGTPHDTLQWRATDSNNANSNLATVTLNLTPVNDDPVITTNCNAKVFPFDGTDEPYVQNTQYSVDIVDATDEDAGDTLTFACTYETLGLDTSDPNRAAAATNCTSLESLQTSNNVLVKSNVTFSTVTGLLTWTPTKTQRGIYKFKFVVSDGTTTDTDFCLMTVTDDYYTTNILLDLDLLFSIADTDLATPLGTGAAYNKPRIDASGDDDASSDSTWLDLTGNSNDGDFLNIGANAPWKGNGDNTATPATPYAIAQASGAGNYITLGDNLSPAITQAMSWEFWFKRTADGYLFTKADDATPYTGVWTSAYQYFSCILYDDANSLTFVRLRGQTDVNDSKWHHAACTYDGANTGIGSMNIYVDGQKELAFDQTDTTILVGMDTSTHPANIGNVGDGAAGTTFGGDIGITRVYNEELTESIIKSNYNSLTNRFREVPVENILEENLVVHMDASNYERGLRFGGIGFANIIWWNIGSNSMNGTLNSFAAGGWKNSVGLYSLGFDGVNDYVSIDDHTDLDLTDNFSFFTWAKSIVDNQTGKGIAGKWNSGSNEMSFSLQTGNTDNTKFRATICRDGTWDANCKDYETSINYADGNWHNFGFTYSSGTLTLYVDGIADTTATKVVDGALSTGVHSGSAKLSIGALTSGAGGSDYFDGEVSILQLYNDVLGAQEVNQNCRAQEDRFGGGICTPL